MDEATKFPIDENVPIPASAGRPSNRSGRKVTYPWADMKPGGSFFVPGARQSSYDRRANTTTIVSASYGRKKFPGSIWCTRAVTEDGINGVRVWRVA